MRVATAGELDLSTAGALQAQLSALRAAGFAHVVLDLRELTFMDSAGAQLIIMEDRLTSAAGRRFSVIRGVAAVQRVLDVCGLSEELDFGGPTARTAPALRVG